MACENCTHQSQNLVTWSSINSFDNRKINSNNLYDEDNKNQMPGNFTISNHQVFYVDNTSNLYQDYRLCVNSSNSTVCPNVSSNILSENGTSDYGADPFSANGYRSYGAFGGTLAAEWNLDNDDYNFCYSVDYALDCTCLDSDDFDDSVNVADEGVCEE